MLAFSPLLPGCLAAVLVANAAHAVPVDVRAPTDPEAAAGASAPEQRDSIASEAPTGPNAEPSLVPRADAPGAQVSPTPLQSDPGWSKQGAVAGFAFSALPLGLGVASVVMMWLGNQTAQDWLTFGAGVSGALGLVPTLGARSAVLVDEQLLRRSRAFRIIGWIMTGYGAFGLLAGLAVGRVYSAIAQATGFNFGRVGGSTAEQTAQIIGRTVSSVTTLINAGLCSVGLLLLSVSANVTAQAASEPQVAPTVGLLLSADGALVAAPGLTGRF